MSRPLALFALCVAGPAWAAHDGIVRHRSMPEPSDIALAIFAAGAVWFVRRALRARFARGGTRPIDVPRERQAD